MERRERPAQQNTAEQNPAQGSYFKKMRSDEVAVLIISAKSCNFGDFVEKLQKETASFANVFGCCKLQETQCADWYFVNAGAAEFIQETPAAAARPGNNPRCKAAKQQTSTRDVSWPKHNRNYTGLHNYRYEANYTDKSDECLGAVLVKFKASWLWDFGLPGRLIQRGLPSAHLKAPSSGNQALHCCQCCTGSVISW